jgi:hypothetical protein
MMKAEGAVNYVVPVRLDWKKTLMAFRICPHPKINDSAAGC